MTSFANSYTDSLKNDATDRVRVRKGEPPRPRPATTRYERLTNPGAGGSFGSHMPLDTEVHWEWRNPLNVLPAILLLMLLIALAAMVLS